jgi:hypothetical protein
VAPFAGKCEQMKQSCEGAAQAMGDALKKNDGLEIDLMNLEYGATRAGGGTGGSKDTADALSSNTGAASDAGSSASASSASSSSSSGCTASPVSSGAVGIGALLVAVVLFVRRRWA